MTAWHRCGHDGAVGINYRKPSRDSGDEDRPSASQPSSSQPSDPHPVGGPHDGLFPGELPPGAGTGTVGPAWPPASHGPMGAFERLKLFLDQEDWTYAVADDFPMVSAGFAGRHGEWRVLLSATDDGLVSIDSVLGQRVPAERRMEMTLLLTLVNYGLRMGGFQFDFNDGEIRFHTSADVEDSTLSRAMIRNLLHTNLATTDHHYRAIMAVSYGNVAAFAAHESLNPDAPGPDLGF